jgi:polysaccharide biosynthesis transport protein
MLMLPPLGDKYAIDTPPQADPADVARRSNRRRLFVFLFVFSATLVPGLVWNLLRPAEYRATARVQVTPGNVTVHVDVPAPATPVAQASSQVAPAPRPDLLTQSKVLTSRPFLDQVRQRVMNDDPTGALLASDPDIDLPSAIAAAPIPGTDILEIQAIGRSPALIAKLANSVVAVYRDKLYASHGSASQDAAVNARDEVARLNTIVTTKRSQLAAFRERSGVVSSERAENEALARIKGLSESLNKASEDAAKADARLRTLRESAVSGRSPVLSKDNPTLAAIEQRISLTREDLRDMERTYTPDFMKMDPTARALRARLTELEQQLASSKASSQQAALTAAEEEVAATHATVERLRAQLDSQRRPAQVFSGNFNEAQVLEADLTRLEATRRSATEQLAKLLASEKTRRPGFTLIEPASVPNTPWGPPYLRDGLINVGASFLLGLLAMGFVELFNRRPPTPVGYPATMIMPPHWMMQGATFESAASRRELPPSTDHQPRPQLMAQVHTPRELTQDEVTALLDAADSEARLLCAFLLLGLTVDEVKVLSVTDFDPAANRLNVRGTSARTLTLPEWLAQTLPDWCAITLKKPGGGASGKPLFCNAVGQPFGAGDIAVRITCAALDAGLEAPSSITPEALRHTCIAHLVRQQVRFSELPLLVGHLSPTAVECYAATSSGPRYMRGYDVDPIMPALRNLQIQ